MAIYEEVIKLVITGIGLAIAVMFFLMRKVG